MGGSEICGRHRGGLSGLQAGSNKLDISITGRLEDDRRTSYDGSPIRSSSHSLEDSLYTSSYTELCNNGRSSSRQGDITIETLPSDTGAMDGAGLSPMEFSVPQNSFGGDTLAESTNESNWPQRVVEELKDFSCVLTPHGRIISLSPSVTALTGYPATELVGKFIIDFIYPEDSRMFIYEFNESTASRAQLRISYRFRKKNGVYAIYESQGRLYPISQVTTFGSGSATSFCTKFFMMTRANPTQISIIRDSSLQHENKSEWITEHISDPRKEEAEETREAFQDWQNQEAIRSEVNNQAVDSASTVHQKGFDVIAMRPPPKPYLHGGLAQLCHPNTNRQNELGFTKNGITESEWLTHLETIEMLTGLRYQEGERSQGISTGSQNASLTNVNTGTLVNGRRS